MKAVRKSVPLILTGLAGLGWIMHEDAAVSSARTESQLLLSPRLYADGRPPVMPRSATAPPLPVGRQPADPPEAGITYLPGQSAASSRGTGPATAPPHRMPAPRPPVLPPPARWRGPAPPAPSGPDGIPPATAGSSVILDLPLEAALPAIAAAPDETQPNGSPAASLAADQMMKDFMKQVTGPDTGSGVLEPTQEAGTALSGDAWRNAVKSADARFLALYGKAAYLHQSLQAARALLRTPEVP